MHVVNDVGDKSLFVAATLTALVLAGTALVYSKFYDQRAKRTQPFEQSTPGDMDTGNHRPLDAHGRPDGFSLTTHEPDSKDYKSSRSKDRRRRGKDPLKEILKGGKKVKSPAQHFFSGKPIDDNNSLNTPSTPTTSSPKRLRKDDSIVSILHSRTNSDVSQSNTAHQRTASSISISSDHHPSSSSHNGTEDTTIILEQRNPDILSRQARETHLAVPTPTIFSSIQNNNHSAPYSSSASSATNTTTASCVITPATSPSLSYTSSKSVPEAGNPEYNNSDCGPKSSPTADPSHALHTDTKSRTISQKQLLSPNPTPAKSKSKSKTDTANPWEWDGTGEILSVPPSISASVIASAPLSTPASSAPPDIVYRKPPRLQSKSLWSKIAKNDLIPGSVSHPSMLLPTSASFADSPLLSPSMSSSFENIPSRVPKVVKEDDNEEVEERDTTEDTYTQLEFPTLNPTVSTSSSLASNGPSAAAGPSNSHRPPTPRRAHGSRRPSTPSGSTHSASESGSGPGQPPPTPALSTQTQLASLRGALEAARLREEKHKAEMEKYTKELDTLRWENMNSRRGEVELQNHIRHLMHQLQMYTSLFASVSQTPTSQQQPPQQTQGPMVGGAELSNSGDGAASDTESGNGPTSSSATHNVQSPATAVIAGPPVSSSPMNLYMLPPLQLNGLSSPVSASGVFPPSMPSVHPPSSYFSYPMPPPTLHPHAVMPSPHPMFAQQFHHMQQQLFQQYQQHQLHMQNQNRSPSIQAQQTNLIPMLHPPSLAAISSYQSGAASSSPSMASGSRSSSRPSTGSTGSSPDLNGSQSPASGAKRRARTRTQTANGNVGGRAGWNDASDGWVVGGVGIDEGDERRHENIHEFEEQGENGDGDEVESGFNVLLEGAIMKRPGSIGVHSGKKGMQALEKETEKSKDRELEQLENVILDVVEPLTDFRFPSLSDLGNVHTGDHYQSSSSSSPVVVSQAPEDLGPDVLHPQALADRPLQDIVHIEAAVSQLVLDNRNENQPSSNTASSSPNSERTPCSEESESYVTEPLMGRRR